MIPDEQKIEEFEQGIGPIIAEAVKSHRDDIDRALDLAERKLSKLPGWDEYQRSFARIAIRSMINHRRHCENVQQRKDAGEYGPAAKVTRGKASSDIARQKTMYDYFIGGKTIGATTGEELRVLADSESKKAEGYMFNSRLCEALARVVPKMKTVQETITEKKLMSIWHSCSLAANRKRDAG